MSTDQEKIAKLEAHHQNSVLLFEKYDKTLEKLSEVATNITQMLAVHEARLNQQEKDTIELARSSEKDISKIYELQSTFEDKCLKNMLEFQHDQNSQCNDKHNKIDDELEHRFESIDTRLKRMEKFQYILIGGGAVIGFLFSKGIPILLALL